MQSKRVFYFILSVALVSLACGIGQGLPDFNIPFVSTKTSTPPPANTPTVTPTYPPKLESSNDAFELNVLENESTTFTDKGYGYRLRFPVEWLPVPLDESNQTELFEALEAELPESMYQKLQTTRQQAGVRLVVLDYTEKYGAGVGAANIVVVFKETTSYTEMEMEDLLNENAEAVPTQMPEANVTYQAVQTNPNGVVYGKILITHPADTFGIPLTQIAMMVKTEAGLLTVTGSVSEEFYAEVEHVFQRIFDSLEFTE